MSVTELKLTNYRGAKSLRLEFSEMLLVFYGVNGAGKSTVLDAIAIMLSRAVSRIRHSGGSGRPIADSDISNGKSFSALDISCVINQRSIKWRMLKNKEGHSSPEEKSDFQELNYFTKGIQGDITTTSGKVNLPLFVYYPVNRAVLDIPLRIREKHQFDLLAAYDYALTSGANFRTFFEWFREREDLENENRKFKNYLIKPDDFVFPDPQLETVRKALGQFLPEFGNLTVRRNPLRMEVEKNGKRLTVNQLSDGEKCLIALIGDLARRLAIANPASENPLKGEGIVLVDEIDLHLHPIWQRMIVPKLRRVFPNCQFIISTHSPHIITHVRPENLYLLKQTDSGIEAEQPRESYGKNVDRILEDLMGLTTTRPDAVEADLKEVFQYISAGTLEKARKQIKELKDDIGEDPELVKAEVLIKRKEIIGK
jgi:predicted ATP-binding protein involved in virulence